MSHFTTRNKGGRWDNGIRDAAAEPGFPLWAKPNAGLPRMADRVAAYDLTPEQMGAYALKYIALGARVVGGCCGSTPEHVAAIARAVKAKK